jgi:hypothetical protein
MDRIDEILRVVKRHESAVAVVFKPRPEIYDGMCISIESVQKVSANHGEWNYIPRYQIILTDDGHVLASQGLRTELTRPEVSKLVEDLKSCTDIRKHLDRYR